MIKNIEYEVRFDIVSEITYLGEEEPREHYFKVRRHWAELTFDDEEDEAIAYVGDDGRVEVEGYSSLRDEEDEAIKEMMQEILKK